jgi:recombination protein RecT
VTDTAVAVREERHPIIAAIDARMPEIAEILPDGMKPERFRKVVVQAMLRTPGLWDCTPLSIITAITEAAEVGIEPTGVLGKGWLIPYKGEAKFIPGWRGFVDLLWRADKILLSVDAVRVGDEFSYRRGTDAFLHHVPDLTDPEREASDDNITATYVLASFPDGREDFEVMSRVALERIRAAALAKARDPKKAIWNLHPGEMMKKTPVRRIAKRLPLSPAMQAILARDEEIDYDTPVERVADPKRDGLRDRIASRTAAIRGESTEEPEASSLAGGAEPGETSPPPPAAPRKGDAWMRRLHAVAAERGMDHDVLHDWAVEHIGVESLSDLTPPQRATFMELVERMEVMPPSEDASAHATPAGEGGAAPALPTTPDSEGHETSDSATVQAADDEAVPPGTSSAPAPAPFTDPAALEVYAAAVLGIDEPQPLDKLGPADFDQVFDALGIADVDAYTEWHKRQSRDVRAALMAAHQSPRHRKDQAHEAQTAKPDAEQLQAALTQGGS